MHTASHPLTGRQLLRPEVLQLSLYGGAGSNGQSPSNRSLIQSLYKASAAETHLMVVTKGDCPTPGSQPSMLMVSAAAVNCMKA